MSGFRDTESGARGSPGQCLALEGKCKEERRALLSIPSHQVGCGVSFNTARYIQCSTVIACIVPGPWCITSCSVLRALSPPATLSACIFSAMGIRAPTHGSDLLLPRCPSVFYPAPSRQIENSLRAGGGGATRCHRLRGRDPMSLSTDRSSGRQTRSTYLVSTMATVPSSAPVIMR